VAPSAEQALRVVFFGSPEFAVPTLEALAATADLKPLRVISQPSRPVGRGRKVQPPPVAQDPLQQLTTREIEILRLLGEGNSLTEIAQAIGVAYKTVANTCSIIKSKLGVERTADLIRVSMELK